MEDASHGRTNLGTIEESGLSDAQTSRSPSDGSDRVSDRQATEHDPLRDAEEDDDEEFTYPTETPPPTTKALSADPSPPPPPAATTAPTSSTTYPSPAQLESIFSAASSGNLELLKKEFHAVLSQGETEAFALANDATSRTGLTPLHAAASRGHLDVVRWLIQDCGALPDMEDKEGETALHKAALNGHHEIVAYLLSLPNPADVHAQDGDGWTALHNACSKGYLDIVRHLCEKGGAAELVPSMDEPLKGIDRKSKGGWTPLMNAASKGHLPVVLYLLSKQNANPLIRNNWGETAYDIAAAVFEVWICEVLQRSEAERWRNSTSQYDPLAVHTTVPLVLYENQKLDARLKTLAMSSGRPKFSASGLGRRGRRAPFELRLPPGDEDQGKSYVAAWRSDVQLPLLEDPFTLPKPKAGKEGPNREGVERSHFWLSDWTMDLTHPRVDVDDGWQYARSFDDPDDQWTAEIPPQLERLLSGSGVVTAGLGGSPGPSSSRPNGSSPSSTASSTAWVRRRRWVRVMRRRLDIPPLPFLEPDGAMYHLAADGTMVPFYEEPAAYIDDGEGQELGSMPTTFLSMTQDYVARARYLAGLQHSSDSDSIRGPRSAADVKRAIAKLERAVVELRTGMLGDHDLDRKTQAEVLLNTYNRALEKIRLAAGAEGLLQATDDDVDGDDEADSSDESFHYPSTSPTSTTRPASVRSHTPDYFARPSTSRVPTDLTPQLSQAPGFRVPTHEAPQKVHTPRWTAPTPHQVHAQWERDDAVSECRSCKRRFTFLFRKHHCRKCGRIFCDRCSSYRATLDPSDIVMDPTSPGGVLTGSQRVCETCYDQTTANVPGRFQGARTSSMERIVVDQGRLSIPRGRQEASSQISDLADCPVCGRNLAELETIAAQEAHVKNCLEGGARGPGIQQAGKYLVYRLPSESALVGIECVICLEEFQKGSTVARLSCLCTFHNTCLSAWLQRGRTCPVHARDT